MKNFMNSVKIANPNTNLFDLSFDLKTSFRMGYLIPSPPIECMPGDKVTLGAKSLIRFAPLVAPVMHRFDVRHEYYFVPYRLLWADWEKYITQTEVAGSLPTHPFVELASGDANPAGVYRLLNHMGIPFIAPNNGNQEQISPFACAAYQMIWDQYYRDQNLIAQIPESYTLTNGNNVTNKAALLTLRKRAWERDYYTSALPEAQKGDPVMIPIGSQKVVLDPTTTGTAGLIRKDSDHTLQQLAVLNSSLGAAELIDTNTSNTLVYDPNETLITEDSGEATSINDLRLAYALQKLKEKLMRGGSRLTEFLRVVFGVFPQDARLQRAEYIGGVKTPVVISEVLSTAETTELPQGNMAGHGVAVADGNYSSFYCPEHGVILCITSLIPRTAYQNGIDKHWFKIDDPTDYPVPDLAHIGEQTVQNREVFAFQGATGVDEFGYQVRFGEMRQNRSFTTGEFQTAAFAGWTATRRFTSAGIPALNQQFVECTPTTDIFAVADAADQIYAHIYHDIKCVRKLPKFGTPTY